MSMEATHEGILLTGHTGKLGRAIVQSKRFLSLLTPSRSEFDLTKPDTVEQYFREHEINAVIHCAALARIGECEKNPTDAIAINVIGTCNLVISALNTGKRTGRGLRFIHISSDGVYPGVRGRYKEEDAAIPYNNYGWSKLGAECAVQQLKNFCIIRTNFFDQEYIQFDRSATDIYNSKMKIGDLVLAIDVLLKSDFVGTINVGSERKSDYDRYKPFRPDLKPCLRNELFATIPFRIASDSSLDCSRWEKIRKMAHAVKVLA